MIPRAWFVHPRPMEDGYKYEGEFWKGFSSSSVPSSSSPLILLYPWPQTLSVWYSYSSKLLAVSCSPLYVFCMNSTCLISWLPSITLLGSICWCILSLTVTTTSSLWVFFLSFCFGHFWHRLGFVQRCRRLHSVRIWIRSIAFLSNDRFLPVHRNFIGQCYWINIQFTWCGHCKPKFSVFTGELADRYLFSRQFELCMWKMVLSTRYVGCGRLSIHTNNVLQSSFPQNDAYDEGLVSVLGYQWGGFDSFFSPSLPTNATLWDIGRLINDVVWRGEMRLGFKGDWWRAR